MTNTEYRETLQEYTALSRVLPKLSERSVSEVTEVAKTMESKLQDYEKLHGYKERPKADNTFNVTIVKSKIKTFFIVLYALALLSSVSIGAFALMEIVLMMNASMTYGSDYDNYLQSLYDDYSNYSATEDAADE